MDRRNRDRGFTLTELMVTIAVAAIGISLVVPGFDTAVSNSRRATAVNELISTMHLARSEAITRNEQVAVCPSSDALTCSGGWNDGWLYFVDLDRDMVLDAGEEMLGVKPGTPRFTITSVEFPKLAYRPNGREINSPGVFNFCDSRGVEYARYARVVNVNEMGEPQVSETTIGGGAPAC